MKICITIFSLRLAYFLSVFSVQYFSQSGWFTVLYEMTIGSFRNQNGDGRE